jgi:hypothetical protein
MNESASALNGDRPKTSFEFAETTILYRPVGPKELERIAASGYREFPPRPPEQPIFCPVLTCYLIDS